MKKIRQRLVKYTFWLFYLAIFTLLGEKEASNTQAAEIPSSGYTQQKQPLFTPIASTQKTEIAQSIPTPVPPTNEPDFPDVERLPSLDNLLEDTPNVTPPSQQEGNSEITLIVDRFVIEGNTAFSDTEIAEEVLAEYIGRSITFSDLLEIETKISKLYTDNGYLNSGALIPQQKIEEGILTIQVIEGRIERSQIKVNGRLSEEYIRARLNRGLKTPFNINELQEALQLLQLNPLIDRIDAELSVGDSRNLWVLEIEVDQDNAFNPSVFANNSRTPSVGSFQRGIAIRHNNFARGGEQFSFVYRNTDGSNDYDFDFTIPFNSLNGTVNFGYRFIDSDIVESPFDELDFNSQTDEYAISIRQPIILTATNRSTQELALGVEFSRQANATTQDGEPFPLSLGANDEGKTNVIALRFFQDWTRRTRSNVLAARSQFSLGLDTLDATTNVGRPDANFFAWRGQLQWIRLLDTGSNTTLLLRSDIQLSPHDLVSLEQFSVGGSNSVRGYRQDALLGDSGILFSGELRFPFYRWNNNQNSLALIPFTDFGTVWSNQDDLDRDEDTVISIGVGLQLDISDRLNARLDWGIPLIDVEDSDRTLQENGVYFSVEYFPF